jgi:CBS domain-containing protein
MTKNPICCTAEMSILDISPMFVENDCGAIPVVEDLESLEPIGILTDRDIVCRVLAKHQAPSRTKVRDYMSAPLVTVSEKASLEACLQAMEANQIRLLVVVDETGRCSGIVAQADIARHVGDKEAGEMLKKISEPALAASAVG